MLSACSRGFVRTAQGVVHGFGKLHMGFWPLLRPRQNLGAALNGNGVARMHDVAGCRQLLIADVLILGGFQSAASLHGLHLQHPSASSILRMPIMGQWASRESQQLRLCRAVAAFTSGFCCVH